MSSDVVLIHPHMTSNTIESGLGFGKLHSQTPTFAQLSFVQPNNEAVGALLCMYHVRIFWLMAFTPL